MNAMHGATHVPVPQQYGFHQKSAASSAYRHRPRAITFTQAHLLQQAYAKSLNMQSHQMDLHVLKSSQSQHVIRARSNTGNLSNISKTSLSKKVSNNDIDVEDEIGDGTRVPHLRANTFSAFFRRKRLPSFQGDLVP